MSKFLGRLFAALVSLGLFLSVSCSQLTFDGSFSEIPKTSKISKNTNKVKTSTYVFDLAAVPSITIEISSNEWNTFLDNYDKNSENETMVKADFKFQKGGDIYTYQNIGFRIKGNTSRRRPEGSVGQMHNPLAPDWHHAHFKLDLDQFNSVGTNFFKLDGLNLKWCKDDPSYVREVYCYNLLQKFGVWTAPLVSYCKVYIKIKEDPTAAYFGIYEMIEPYDERYIKARFPDELENGFLWKCLYGANLGTPGVDDIGIEYISPTNDSSLSYRPCYDLKTQKTNFAAAKARLVSFINDLNTKTGAEFVTWIKSAMDVDLLLRAWAVNNLVGSWDSYWTLNGNNYYLYFDDLGKCYFIPFDFDNTLGNVCNGFADTGIIDIVNWGPNPGPILLNKVLAVAEFHDIYVEYISQLINKTNDLFDFTKSTNRIATWQNLITADVANDTGEDMAISDTLIAGWTCCNFYALLYGEIGTNYFKTRITYAQLQLGLPTNENLWGGGGGGSGGSDTSAPVFDITPAQSGCGTDWIEFIWSLNENSTIYYVLVADGSPAPTTLEVKNLQASGGGFPLSGATDLCPNPSLIYGGYLSGLPSGTSYDIYIVAEDFAEPPNLQASPTLINISTAN